jgi:hypothetical protein
MPPNTDSFDIANKAPVLNSVARRAAQPPQAGTLNSVPSTSSTVDLNALTSVLLLQTLTKSGLISLPSSSEALPRQQSAALSMPTTPTWSSARLPPTVELSPLQRTPTQLCRFLQHAETRLRIPDARYWS